MNSTETARRALEPDSLCDLLQSKVSFTSKKKKKKGFHTDFVKSRVLVFSGLEESFLWQRSC